MRARGRGLKAGYESRGPDNPNTTFNSSKLIRISNYWNTNIQKQPFRSSQCCFIQEACLNFSKNSLENNCVGVLSCKPETCNFTVKETSIQTFFCKFNEILVADFQTFYLHVIIMKHK